MRVLVKFSHGSAGPYFRFLVGGKLVEVAATDAIGDPCWRPASGAGMLDADTLTAKAIDVLAEIVGSTSQVFENVLRLSGAVVTREKIGAYPGLVIDLGRTS